MLYMTSIDVLCVHCSTWILFCITVMIGSAFRKVRIPYSVYMEAFKQDEPQKAVVPVLHAVFPQSVLSCSAVIGNPQRGIQELSPNKLEAIRGAFFIVFNVSLLCCTYVRYHFFKFTIQKCIT